jgi:glycosyltransferase involved in cell wall biosynthesis
MGDPEIAVIVGAYRREPYLLGAVRSVLAQDLARDRYEVLVTKNFASASLDRSLADLGVPALLDDDPKIGPWLMRAVDHTHAPLIAFLDDDDEFEPGRLSEVLRVFREHPEIGFYRNRVRVIDGAGLSLPPDLWRPHEVDSEFDRSGPVMVPRGSKPGLLDLATARTHVTFNSSTMVVRRELLTGATAEALRGTQLPDLGLFLAAALSPFGLYLDDRRLTRFRYYGDNVTHRVRWLGYAAESHRAFAALSRRSGREDLATWFDREAIHYDRLFRGGRIVEAVDRGEGRRTIAQLGAEYLRYLARHPLERHWTLDVWGSEGYAVAYLLSPPLARRAHAARSGAQPL